MNKCKNNVGEQIKAQKGITLLALIITIILMLILATVTVNVVIGGGLFDYASDAVNSTEIASEKEAVQKATILAESTSKTGRVTLEEMQKAIDNATSENVAIVIDTGESLVVKFNESNRYYEIGSNGNIEYLGKLKEKILTVQCADSTGKVLVEKTYTILKEKYSITLPEVEGYEPAVEKIEGEMEESTTISQLYYMIFDDDTTLVFTGLDESGNATTNEASIVSYMVGDGTTTDGNGLLEKTVQGVLKIPKTYKGKQVTRIGQYSFRRAYNIIKADTGDSAEDILVSAFQNSAIKELVIGKNISNLGRYSFWECGALKSITFKNSKTSYGEEFNACFSWTEIKVDSQNATYKVEDNILYSADGKTLIRCPYGRSGEFTIPDTVEEIANSAFHGCPKITKVTIADSVTKINPYAFYLSSGLQELIIGKNVTSYGLNAFNGCGNLKIVTFRNNVSPGGFIHCSSWTEIRVNPENTTFKVEDNILYSYDGTTLIRCPQGREEEEYTIIDGVDTIAEDAFNLCKKIKSIVISENVTTIGYMAFWASDIEQITIGKNVTNCVQNAFHSCSKLKTVIIDSTTIAGQIISQTSCGYLVNVAETIYINEDITTVGSYITNTDNFTVETSDKEGYIKYVKNS